jgi:hypothetical protein
MLALVEGVRTLISSYKSKQYKAASVKLKAAIDKFKLG